MYDSDSISNSSSSPISMFDEFNSIIEIEVKARINEMLTTEDLVRFIDSNPTYVTWVLMDANRIEKELYSRIETGELIEISSGWIQSYYNEDRKPVFYNMNMKKELDDCKYDYNKQKEISSKYGISTPKSDSNASTHKIIVYCGGVKLYSSHYIKESEQVEGITDNQVARDCVCVLSEETNYPYQKMFFVLRAVGETEEERHDIICEIFRDDVVMNISYSKKREYEDMMIDRISSSIVMTKSHYDIYDDKK